MLPPMTRLTARVRHGHLVLDVLTSLPEGTEIALVADDDGDSLTDDERQRLHAALEASWQEAEAGQLTPADEFIAELRARP